MNEYLYTKECNEWIANVPIQIRSKSDISGDKKTDKFNRP